MYLHEIKKYIHWQLQEEEEEEVEEQTEADEEVVKKPAEEEEEDNKLSDKQAASPRAGSPSQDDHIEKGQREQVEWLYAGERGLKCHTVKEIDYIQGEGFKVSYCKREWLYTRRGV